MPNLKCLVLLHKWRPAEAANEPGLRLACIRCGKVRTVGGDGEFSASAAAELAGRRGGE